MPARKTTSTAKTTRKPSTRKTTTTRTGTRKTASKKTTTQPQQSSIETLTAQFQEMGGTINTDGERTTITFEDRYTTIESTNLNQWIQENLGDIESIYQRSDQKQWVETTFPDLIVKASKPQEIEQVNVTQTKLTEDGLKETAQKEAQEIVGLLNTPTGIPLTEKILTKIQDLQGIPLKRDALIKHFDIQTDTDDDIELCSQLSSLGVNILISNTGSSKGYTVTI